MYGQKSIKLLINNMSKNIVKSFIILALIGWCVFDFFGVIQVTNTYELLVGFILLLLPFILALFYLSFSLKKDGSGWQKKIAIAGIYVGILSLIINVIVFIFDFISGSRPY